MNDETLNSIVYNVLLVPCVFHPISPDFQNNPKTIITTPNPDGSEEIYIKRIDRERGTGVLTISARKDRSDSIDNIDR